MEAIYQVMQAIKAIIHGPDPGAAWQLWSLLTILRGPDSDTRESQELKSITTGQIRRLLFGGSGRWIYMPEETIPVISWIPPYKPTPRNVPPHFMGHYNTAYPAALAYKTHLLVRAQKERAASADMREGPLGF